MSRKIGVILSYALMVFEVLSTLLLTPFIIRTLGQAEYGVYKLAFAINAYLLLLDLGIGNAIVRYIAKYKSEGNVKKERQFFSVAIVFYLIIAFIAIIAGIVLVFIFPSVFAKGLNQEEIHLGQILLGITMVNSAITLGTAPYNNVLIAYEKFAVSRSASIVQIIFRMILTYVVLKLGWGSIGIVCVNLLMTILCRAYFAVFVFAKIKLKPLFKNIDLSFIKEIVVYSSLILLQMVATQLNSSVDQILIGSLVKSSAVILAVYSVGTQIVQYFQSIGNAFTNVLMPGVVRLVGTNATSKSLTDEMIRIGRIIFMTLSVIYVGFIVCGREFIVLWAGNDNTNAYYVTVILMSAYIIILTESIGTQILWALNEHKEQSFMKIAVVLLNILLTAFLIKRNPLIGATIGTFISLFLGDVVVLTIILKKKLKINLKDYFFGLIKGILPCVIVSGLCGVVINQFLPQGWLWLLIKIAVIVTAYIVMMFVFGMNQYEKNLILSMLKKVKNNGGK